MQMPANFETHLVENGGMKLLHMGAFTNGGAAQFVGFTHRDTRFNPATRHPHGEAVGIVVSASSFGVFCSGLTAKFPTPNHECAIQHTRTL